MFYDTALVHDRNSFRFVDEHSGLFQTNTDDTLVNDEMNFNLMEMHSRFGCDLFVPHGKVIKSTEVLCNVMYIMIGQSKQMVFVFQSEKSRISFRKNFPFDC